jgi:hypothetical protein
MANLTAASYDAPMRASRLALPLFLCVVCAAAAPATEAPPRGADELFWVPTLEQALEMSAATGRPIFLMGYSLVGDGTTYTKTSDDACSGVY